MLGGCRRRGYLLAWDQPSLPGGTVTNDILDVSNLVATLKMQ
jgi:hypothetical protein